MRYKTIWKHLLILWYDIKSTIPGGFWPFFILVGGGVLLIGVDNDASSQILFQAFLTESLFPLLTAFFSYRIILIDEEEQRVDFLKTREAIQCVWGHRLWNLMTVAAFSLCGMWLGWQIVGHESLTFTAVLLAFLVPTLALSSVGSLMALLVRRVAVSDLILTFWWAFCFLSYRAAYSILGPFYLFPLWYSLRVKEGAEVQIFWSQQGVLGGLALILLLVSFFLVERRE